MTTRISIITATLGLCLFACTAAAGTITTTDLVSPAHPDALASPLTFRALQTSTENERMDPATAPYGLLTGLDSYLSTKKQTYDLPLQYAFTPYLQARLDLPLVTATTDSTSGGSSTATGLGDICLSVKLTINMDNLLDFYYIFAARLPTGAEEKGLGTGAYDFSFTHKTITTFGDYRTSFMLGVTIPPPVKFSVMGSDVEYGPTISYMVATERALTDTNLHFTLKAAGLHAFNSRINGVYQHNGLTTLDIIPEAAYKISDSTHITAGVILPLVTIYDLPGAQDKRDTQVNIGIQRIF